MDQRTGAGHNPLGKSTYYSYDGMNRLVRVLDALGEAAYYDYDAVGNLTKSTSPAGRTGNFTYDLANRREKAYYSDSFAAYFSYDAAGNMLTAHEVVEGVVAFTYDRMNRATSQKLAAGAGGGVAYYYYDENSNRTRLIYPSGGTAYYTYDKVDRMTSVKAPSGNSASYEFDASGNRTKSVWGNSTYTYYEYDDALRMSKIRHFRSDGMALAYFDYGRDAAGDITLIAGLDGLTTYYGYDAAKRLTAEDWKDATGSSIYAFEYGYDLAGNRVRALVFDDATYWTYNDAGAVTHRVDSSGTSSYTYDKDGNLTVLEEAGGAVTYFEHAAHGLVSKIKPLGGTEITFAYDAMLRRVRMDEGTAHTYFRHDGINLLEVATSGGSVTKLTHGYTIIDGIGSVVEVDVDGTHYFLHIDHRGTCYKITDVDGDVVWTGLCDAWGKALSEVGANPMIFWYQGQAWWKIVAGASLYYVSPARIYDPRNSTFLERDPLPRLLENQIGGLTAAPTPPQDDLYRYIDSSPVLSVDPWGMFGLQLGACERRAFRFETETPSWARTLGRKIGLYDLKARGHIETALCATCCQSTGTWKKNVSVSAGYLIVAEYGSQEFDLWVLKARFGWYGRLGGQGSVSGGFDECTGKGYGGGCISLSGELGVIGEVSAGGGRIGAGARMGVNVTITGCLMCDSTGCAVMGRACGSIRLRLWAYAKILGRKWQYFKEDQLMACTPWGRLPIFGSGPASPLLPGDIGAG